VSDADVPEVPSPLIDRELIDQIRKIEQATGRKDVLSGFVLKLEGSLAAFGNTFSDHVARGDNAGAVRSAHTLKGTCRQLGAMQLGDLFAEVEAAAKAGDFTGARRKFDAGAALVAQSLDALKKA
jgi:HPt (histidine-containing phosphotransfer) domain-containing protein